MVTGRDAAKAPPTATPVVFLPSREQKSGQAPHGTGRTSLPLLPSGPGGVRAPAHAWDLAGADRRAVPPVFNRYFRFREARISAARATIPSTGQSRPTPS